MAPPSLTFDFTTGTLPGAITFTRASIGTYTNNAGTLITASNNVARFNYIAGVANLLIEGTATNLLLQSMTFPPLGFQWGVITSSQFVSPDGTNNGWKVAGPSGFGGVHESITFSNVTYTTSAWMKTITNSDPIAFRLNNVDTVVPLSTTLTRVSATATPPPQQAMRLSSQIQATLEVPLVFTEPNWKPAPR